MSCELLRLRGQRARAGAPAPGSSSWLDLLDRGDVHGGREGVVRRLAAIDVVVRVDRLLARRSRRPASRWRGSRSPRWRSCWSGCRSRSATRPAGNGRPACRRSPRPPRRRSASPSFGSSSPSVDVGQRPRPSSAMPERPHQRRRHALAADLEVLQASAGSARPSSGRPAPRRRPGCRSRCGMRFRRPSKGSGCCQFSAGRFASTNVPEAVAPGGRSPPLPRVRHSRVRSGSGRAACPDHLGNPKDPA